MEGTPEEYLPVYFRGHEYYLDYHKSYRAGKKNQFNIAAFFVTGYWLIYRKMYVYALIYFFGTSIIQIVMSVLLALQKVTNIDSIIAWEMVFVMVTSTVCGFLGNRLYVSKALRDVQKTLQKYPLEADRTRKLRKSGGTSFWFAVVLIVQILLFDLAN